MLRLRILVASCCLLGAAPALSGDPTAPTTDFSRPEDGERYPGGTATPIRFDDTRWDNHMVAVR